MVKTYSPEVNLRRKAWVNAEWSRQLGGKTMTQIKRTKIIKRINKMADKKRKLGHFD